MRVFVTAKPGAKRASIEKIDETHFMISVKEAPYKGYANKAIEETLANYYHIARSKVILLRGATSRQKIFEVSKD